MAKAKVKKQDTFIDMTAMSDVTVLLLTFFMLTSTFIAAEPVQVTTPTSVSEFPIPEQNLMTILINPAGKVFLGFTNQQDRIDALTAVGEDYGITFTDKQINSFKKLEAFGVPIRSMASFLDLPDDQQLQYMQDLTDLRVGVPIEELSDARGEVSSDNEFIRWVSRATTNNKDLLLAIKADGMTDYPIIKRVMDDLRGIRQNRYLMITSLKTASNT